MASTKAGHIALDGIDYAIAENTYIKQVQTPFNNRFSTGDQSVGDLSFFQFLSMDDFSGGNGQEVFEITNQYFDSDGVDVTTPQELKLAPKIEKLASVNGPQHEHLNEPVEDEDGWPQVIEWLGKAVIFNDRIEHDAGGVEFLEVFETDVLRDRVTNKDTSGNAGVITNEANAEIMDISKVEGLPGDTIKVKVKFSNLKFYVINAFDALQASLTNAPKKNDPKFKLQFRLYFGGSPDVVSINPQTFVYSEIKNSSTEFDNILFSKADSPSDIPSGFRSFVTTITKITPIEVEFTLVVPSKSPGIYNLWTSAEFQGKPFTATSGTPLGNIYNTAVNYLRDNNKFSDSLSNAKVLFFLSSVDDVLVTRKNLYAPQLKAACVSGEKLIGGRVYDGTAYIEVYEEQNGAVDRTLQINLTAVSAIPSPPSYMSLLASNDVIIAAFDNFIYKIDIATTGLTDAQRITSIGTVPGTYVSGMEVWNQRVYIASFDKSSFTSHISWSNLEIIQSSYAIDGKFWITDLATFNGALFYSGGTQDGIGQVRAFPAEIIMELSHPQFDNRVRTLNAGRKLYAGWSHGTGIGVVTERGASTWAKTDLGEEPTNVVWDLEEVGDTVFVLANSGLFKTTNRYVKDGFLETSKIGANTSLIDKDWSSVTVELKERLMGSHKVKVWASNAEAPDVFTLLGELGMENDLTTVFQFPQNFASPWVKLFIELSTTDEMTTPIIKKITIKYVPQSLNKLQWTFGVRAYDNISLLNGLKDARSGSDILGNLFDLPSKGSIVFRDIDDNEYNVTISDMKQTNPIINKASLEGLVMVELLEL